MAALLGAVGVWLWGPPSVAGYDTSYAIAWGRDLIRSPGSLRSQMPAGTPTAHPLAMLLSVLLAPVGAARQLMAFLVVVLWVLSIGIFSFLAAAAATELTSWLPATSHEAGGLAEPSNTSWSPMVAGTTTVAILGLSPQLAFLGLTASLDFAAVLSLGWGAFLLWRRRSRAAFLVLTVGALQRPEIWVMLAASLTLWAVQTKEQSNPKSDPTPGVRWSGRSRRRAAEILGWLILAPLCWVGTGLLFGSPLAALTSSRSNAATLHRDTGLGKAATSLLKDTAGATSWPATIVVLLIVLSVAIGSSPSLILRRHRGTPGLIAPADGAPALATLLVVALIIAAACYLGEGLLGTALLARYLVLADFLGATLLGTALGLAAPRLRRLLARAWRRHSKRLIRSDQGRSIQPAGPQSRRPGRPSTLAVFAAALAVGLVLGVHPWHQYVALSQTLRTQDSVDQSLQQALDQTMADCRTVPRVIYTAAPYQTPVIADHLKVPVARVEPIKATSQADSGIAIYPRDIDAILDAGYGPVVPADITDTFPIPPGYTPSHTTTHWASFQRCTQPPQPSPGN